MSFNFPTSEATAFVFIAASTALPPTALAQPLRETRSYAIPAGPLADVLLRFAAMSGVTLRSSVEPLRSVRSQGLRGDYTIDDGFARLLGASGYAATRTADRGPRLQTSGSSLLPARPETRMPRWPPLKSPAKPNDRRRQAPMPAARSRAAAASACLAISTTWTRRSAPPATPPG